MQGFLQRPIKEQRPSLHHRVSPSNENSIIVCTLQRSTHHWLLRGDGECSRLRNGIAERDLARKFSPGAPTVHDDCESIHGREYDVSMRARFLSAIYKEVVILGSDPPMRYGI